jgi:hypothetical protein
MQHNSMEIQTIVETNNNNNKINTKMLMNNNNNNNNNNTILIAKFDYESKESNELDLKKNERLILIDNSKNWWLVKKMHSDQTG